MTTTDAYLIFDINLISLTVGLPEGVENWINRMVHHRTTTLHVHIHVYTLHIYIYIHHTTHINYHSWQKQQPSRQWLLLKRLFWPKPWHYYHLFKYLEEFLNVLVHECDIFWVLTLNKRSHIHIDLFNSSFFYLLFCKTKTNFGSLSRGQPQLPDVNHYVFIIFWLKNHWEPHKNEFLKTWNGLQTDQQTHRLTDT